MDTGTNSQSMTRDADRGSKQLFFGANFHHSACGTGQELTIVVQACMVVKMGPSPKMTKQLQMPDHSPENIRMIL